MTGSKRQAASITVQPEIRPARLDDRDALLALFESGVSTRPDEELGDAPDDLMRLDEVYLESENAWLWVADLAGVGPVGMVAVRELGPEVVELRRLRVLPDYRMRGIGTMLVEHALRFCSERAYLKITLDTFVDRDRAISLFEKFGFQFARTKQNGGGGERHDFFLDLYRDASSADQA